MAIPNWLTLATESGNSGTTIVSLTAATNPTESERSYVLTVRNDNTGLSRIVNINQGPKVDYSQDYLTIEVLENSGYLFTPEGNSVWVSEDTDLENWTLLYHSGAIHTYGYYIEEGKAYCLKGNVAANNPIFAINDLTNTKVSIYGNIKSVYGGMESGSPINLTNAFNLTNSQGYGTNTSIVDAANLIIEPVSGQIFTKMFQYCTSLVTAPELPIATDIPDNAYNSMFLGCYSLTTPPSIIYGRNLGYRCCEGMFARCVALETPPQLQGTNLGDYCYHKMFWDCESLKNTPAISATTIGENCFEEMFWSCISLESASAITIPVTNRSCCYLMFYDCSSLTTPPSLPATTVAQGCYQDMFSGCTSLTTAPELPAISGDVNSYYGMFANCTSLSYIKCLAEYLVFHTPGSWTIEDTTAHWTYNVAPIGLFLKSQSMNDWPSGEYGIPTGWVVGDADITQYIYLDKSSISVNSRAHSETIYVFSSSEWSYTTSANWLELSGSNNTLNIEISDNWGSARNAVITISNIEGISQTISVSQDAFNYENEYFTILMSSSGNVSTINRSGTVKSLQFAVNHSDWNVSNNINIDVESGETIELKRNGSANVDKQLNITGTFVVFGQLSALTTDAVELFKNCTGLTSAEHLIFSVSANTYTGMFQGCTSLTTPPELPASAITSNCYAYMFSGCTSLTTAPELPATFSWYHYGSYERMFADCTSLTTAPALPATDLSRCNSAYTGMFQGCTSLTTPPELPATALATGCYAYMFSGCTSLTTAPVLPATSLVSNSESSDNCYENMFAGCTSLTTAPALPATTLTNFCYYQMFRGCTSLTTPPELPASAITRDCYNGMFAGCTSLVTAPELPATTLKFYSYLEMFSGCTSLNYIKCLATDISAEDCTYRWVENVASSGTFVKKSGVNWSRGSDGIPNYWTVQEV